MAEKEKAEGLLDQKIAYVDLTRGTVDTEVVPLDWRLKFIGARGINMYLLSRLTKADTDPLGPDNPLMIGLGLLTGIPGFGSGRCNITAASPVTGPSMHRGNIGDCNIGGHFGAELKHAGFDHLVITGQSPMPVYLLMRNDHIEIRDARRLWGMDTWQTQQSIQREHGDERMRVLCIGPAGENLVRQSTVITGPKDSGGGNPGGGGMGTVMGSKKLKAIAARGSKDIGIAHPREFLDYLKEQIDLLMTRKWIQALGRLGTPLLLRVSVAGGWGAGDASLPAAQRQAKESVFAENLLPYSVGMSACSGCAVHCRHRHLITEGRYAGTRGEGPEFGAMGISGTNDPEAVIYFNDLSNRLGLSTGAGSSVNWAMDLYEKGIINEEMVGYPLKKGDTAAVERLLNDITYRRGFGDVLADGKFALNRLPPEAGKDWAFIKGAMTRGTSGATLVPRAFVFGQLVSSLPAHIHRSRPGVDVLHLPPEVKQKLYDNRPIDPDIRGYEGKAYMIYWHELLNAVCDALGFCHFQTIMNSANCPQYEEWSQLIRLTTDLDMPVAYLREVGERTYTLERMLLRRFGFGDREHDRLPEEFVRIPGNEEVRQKLDEMLDEYYGFHGWDADGCPLPETLERLGLSAEVMTS